jgi:hypothetical protein
MSTPECKVYSFIVKVWLEEGDHEAKTVTWHGYITHVPSGERRYLRDLDSILSFIRPYLADGGADVRPASRLSRWLKSCTRRKG